MVKVTWLILRGFSCGEGDLSVLPECTLYFVHNVMTIFNETVTCLEYNTTTATEVHGIMVKVQDKLQQRYCDMFYESAATKLLQGDDVNTADRHSFEREDDNFLGRCLTYLQKWYAYDNSFIKNVTLLSLSNDIQ